MIVLWRLQCGECILRSSHLCRKNSSSEGRELNFVQNMDQLFAKAVSGGQQDFLAIAIAAQAGEQFVGPCGACRLKFAKFSIHWHDTLYERSCHVCVLFRQFMAEFNPDIPIYLVRPDLEVQVSSSWAMKKHTNSYFSTVFFISGHQP